MHPSGQCVKLSVKPKTQWQPQEFGEVKNREKNCKGEEEPAKDRSHVSITRSAIEVEPPQLFEVHDLQ